VQKLHAALLHSAGSTLRACLTKWQKARGSAEDLKNVAFDPQELHISA
jgi:hypothetical protein